MAESQQYDRGKGDIPPRKMLQIMQPPPGPANVNQGNLVIAGNGTPNTYVYVTLYNPGTDLVTNTFAVMSDNQGVWNVTLTGIIPANFPGNSLIIAQENPPTGNISTNVVQVQGTGP
jgi:hypothetical protein